MRKHLEFKVFELPQEMAKRADLLWEACNASGRSVAALSRHDASPRQLQSPWQGKKTRRNGLCFFHNRFCNKARRYVSLCSCSENGAAADNCLGVGSNLIYYPELCSSQDFLVDTGATCSVMPHKSTALASGPKQVTTNGQQLRSWGYNVVDLCFGILNFWCCFMLTNVEQPIHGCDFFSSFPAAGGSSVTTCAGCSFTFSPGAATT